METPIVDFLNRYALSTVSRLHMPGHKGIPFLGCEAMDITEISGADSLYEAEGIIAESEANATKLFGSGRTIYAAEGSSQCIRAMLYLVLTNRPSGTAPVIVAARNAHKAFIYAAGLLDFEIVWLWPEEAGQSLCTCPISSALLERTLKEMSSPPAAVYLTSPDYLGGQADVAALAKICHQYGTVLAVDNAHGAYLHFLEPAVHPMDLGADICCDSAHKTFPVLTGGAYLHISTQAPGGFQNNARTALALFGSTSPSYLILASLDRCNRYLAEDYPSRLAETVARLDWLKVQLEKNGWRFFPSDPLKLTIDAAASGTSGQRLGERLRQGGVEYEYADPNFLVLMATPENTEEDFNRVLSALGRNDNPSFLLPTLSMARGERVMSVRDAIFSPHETLPAAETLGRICAAPTVSCPPAIPIAVSGERIGPEAMELFSYYGVSLVDVVKESFP